MTTIVKLDDMYFELDEFSLLEPGKELSPELFGEDIAYILYTKQNGSHYLTKKAGDHLKGILAAKMYRENPVNTVFKKEMPKESQEDELNNCTLCSRSGSHQVFGILFCQICLDKLKPLLKAANIWLPDTDTETKCYWCNRSKGNCSPSCKISRFMMSSFIE